MSLTAKDKINDNFVSKLKNMNINQLNSYCSSIRNFLIDLSKQKEIHLSSNLGIVELTISLFLNFNFSKDTIIYDTGHQTYIHKIITGRVDEISNFKTKLTKCGLMDMNESIYDHYSPGHSGNVLSVIAGMCLTNINSYHVCIIGDSTLNTGLSFEGLNYISEQKLPIIIILNDNQMGISHSKGYLSIHLNDIDDENNFFTNLGFQYIGPIDGHNIESINLALQKAKNIVQNGPVIVHCKTIKGKGLLEAQDDKIGTHHTPLLSNDIKFGDIAFKNLFEKINNDTKLWIINPAMNYGTGFFKLLNHKRYIDVGIAESHAISLASGLIIKKQKVFVIFYSTFLQRAYDQLIHDVSRLKLNLTILLDRSDLAPHEGKSHHGIFDLGYLNSVPNTRIYTPRNFNQLNKLIDYCYSNNDGVINVIRYPTKPFLPIYKIDNTEVDIFKFEHLIEEKNKTIIVSYGAYTNRIYNFIIDNKLNVNLINLISLTNIDNNELLNLLSNYEKIIIYERVYDSKCIFDEIIRFANKNKFNKEIISLNYKDFPNYGLLDDIDQENNLDLKKIINLI